MKHLLKYFPLIFLACVLFQVSCSDDEEIIVDNALRVLSQKINGETVSNGVADISKDVNIELLMTHTLNTNAFETALSFTGPSGPVDYSLTYSNTNSAVVISNDNPLDFETTYTLAIAAGPHSATGEILENAYTLSFTTAPFVPSNVTLSTDVNTINEAGDDVAVITATLSEVVALDVSMDLDFGGTANNGSDYTTTASNLMIPAGELTASMEVRGSQDGEIEGTEFIEVAISNIVNAEVLTPQMVSIGLLDDDLDSNGDGFPDQGFIINEVLFDPPGGDAGDANGDGTRSASEDEFIEFVNDSDQAVDLSGYTLFDETNLETMEPRHTFPQGTVVEPGGVYVLFGGGSAVGDFGTAQIGFSTSGNMNLSNADDVITILDASGNVFLSFDTQTDGVGLDFGADQSITRFEDINGDYALHTTANLALLFSPGKKSDGSNFAGGVDPGVGFIINEVLFDPPGGDAGDANGDGTRSASEDEFIEFFNDSDQPVDLSGFTLFDATNLETMEPRHTFPAGTIVAPRSAYVLFGGGTPTGTFGGAAVGVSTTGNMNFSNSDDVLTILDASGNVFLTFDTQTDGAGLDFGADQSITRSPDITGPFVIQADADPAFLFTPGTKSDGSSF